MILLDNGKRRPPRQVQAQIIEAKRGPEGPRCRDVSVTF